MAGLAELEKRVKKLENKNKEVRARNKRVEADKAWETSYSRRFLLVLFTYLAIGFYLSAISVEQPWLNAIVPAVAFMLSTLTLPFFKKHWTKHFYKK